MISSSTRGTEKFLPLFGGSLVSTAFLIPLFPVHSEVNSDAIQSTPLMGTELLIRCSIVSVQEARLMIDGLLLRHSIEKQVLTVLDHLA